MAKKLTEKQRRFVEAYMGRAQGNATEAARLAGYKGSDKTLRVVGSENLTKPYVFAAIQDRVKEDPLVYDRKGLMAWWSQMMSGAEKDADRLRASELLAKVQGLFVKKIESTIQTKGGTPLALSTNDDAPLDDAENEPVEPVSAEDLSGQD